VALSGCLEALEICTTRNLLQGWLLLEHGTIVYEIGCVYGGSGHDVFYLVRSRESKDLYRHTKTVRNGCS